MDTALFFQQRTTMQQRLAEEIGCAPADFETEKLTIVTRPGSDPIERCLVVGFGLGTVVSVVPRLRAFVEENMPTLHYWAFNPGFLGRMAAECSTTGERLDYHKPGLFWAMSDPPVTEGNVLPEGYSLEVADRAWMATQMASSRWEHALGEPGPGSREDKFQFACAIVDTRGQPVAIAGVFSTWGMNEIGVDVARGHRGNGFGDMVVGAAAREILDRGRVPLYGCAATNIRSQRTALACGFLPAFSMAWVGAVAG